MTNTILPQSNPQNLPSKLLNVQEKEKQDFDDWFENAVILDPLVTSYLVEFYDCYVEYVAHIHGTVPLSKKIFSKLLKNVLSDLTKQCKVKIYSKSKLQ